MLMLMITIHYILKLERKKDDVDKITLIYGDPYDYKDNSISGNLALSSSSWNTTRMVMKKNRFRWCIRFMVC